MIRKDQNTGDCISLAQMQIIFNSRIFWRQLATWTRAYLNSRYLGIGISEDVFGHLLNVPAEFSSMIRLIFGGEVSEKYLQLLNQHIILIRELIAAQLNNDIEAINHNVNGLYQNGEARAAFLASINPKWEEAEWRNMIDTYHYLTVEEANSFATGDYTRNIETYDNLTAHTDLMGDYFAYGLYQYIAGAASGFAQPITAEQCISFDQMTILYYIRIFWFEMSTWTRALIIGKATNSDYANAAYGRLLQVPIQYSNLLKTFFDEELVNRNVQLINTHIGLINDLVAAQINNDSAEVNRTVQLLYQNSDERAAALAKMNPYLDQYQWRSVLYSYLRSTIDQITTFLSGDYERNIDIFQRLLDQTERMSNIFSESLFNYASAIEPDHYKLCLKNSF